jgi:hypothetical protein
VFLVQVDHDSEYADHLKWNNTDGSSGQSRWSFGKSLLFAIAAMSTAGLVSPEIDDGEMMFSALYSILGVCAYAMFIGAVVDVVNDKFNESILDERMNGKMKEDAHMMHKLMQDGLRENFCLLRLKLPSRKWPCTDVNARGM